MNGHFVEVSTDLLNQLRRRPSLVEELFECSPTTRTPLEVTDAMRQRLPHILTPYLEANPAMRDLLAERLGFSARAGHAGVTAQAVLEKMAERGYVKGAGLPQPPVAVAAGTFEGQGESLSIDKAWHGVHYLLSGAAEPGTNLLSQLVLGGTELGADFSGYGSARYFTAETVTSLAREWNAATLIPFDADRMTKLGIYPGGWRTADAEWLMDQLGHLRAFVERAGGRGNALVTCIL